MKRRSAEEKAALAVAIVAALVFLPSVSGDFVFDDHPLIVTNDYVHEWRFLPRAFGTHLWDVSLYNAGEALGGPADVRHRFYRPLVTVSYLFDWMLGGGKPWLFHLVNTLVHAAATWLATRAAMRWTKSLALGVFCGAVFALHPTRTECVTWISGRTDLFMALFVLLAVEAFSSFERRRAAHERHAWTMFGLGVGAMIAGVLSKEPAVMLPFLIFADRASARPTSATPLVPAVTLAACGAYLVSRMLFWAPEGHVQRIFTPGHFLLTVGIYVERSVFPWPPTMYYHALEIDASGAPVYSKPLMALGAVATIAFSWALLRAWRHARAAFWLLVASAAFMGPLLNIYFTKMNVSAQDRFLYLPLFLVVTGLLVVFRERAVRIASQRIVELAAAGIALAAVGVIEIRTLDYRSNRAFWEAELAQSPNHPYGLEMLAILAAKRGDLEEAYDYFTRSEQPEARKYRLAVGDQLHVRAHFQRAAVLAALLPDGEVEELRGLLDELWRVVEPERVPRRAMVRDYLVGGPMPVDDAQRRALERSFQWDIALVATRLGDFRRATLVVDRAPRHLVYVSSNPLNAGVVLARLGRYDEADEIHAELGRRGIAVDELAAASARTQKARATTAARDRATDANTRAMLEATRLADLGAYFAAVAALPDGALREAGPATPFIAQLLVACRFDDAARALARKALPPEQADAVIADIARSLPPRLRDMKPVPADLTKVDTLARQATK